MSSRRDEIRMSDVESFAFLERQRFGVLGTVGRDGVAHMVNVNYLVDGHGIVFTSFTAAQKVKNIERSGQASLLVEIRSPYSEIQGVLLSGVTTVVTDTDHVIEVTLRMMRRHREMAGDAGPGVAEGDVARHALKRAAIYIAADRLVSWDHRRLAGRY
jgi:PPOX class probable F420-dependent enzyme